MAAAAYELVVLAGGSSRRFGTDKLALLLDRTLQSLPAGAPIVCVGPPRPTPARPDVTWVRESPAGSGPLAGVAAALGTAAAAGAAVVVLLGGDMPAVGAAVLPLLAALADAGTVDAVLLADDGGRGQLLASAWHRSALTAALDTVGDPGGVPLQRLLDGARVTLLPDRWGAAHDVDTPADLSAGPALPAGPASPKPTVE
jgi:molybdopterin-guanine dinucleotide biosynthesis protein A